MASQGSLQLRLRKLLVGNRDQILVVNFNGTEFTIAGRYVRKDWMPSWLLFKEPDLIYAVNSRGDDTSVFKLSPGTSTNTNRMTPYPASISVSVLPQSGMIYSPIKTGAISGPALSRQDNGPHMYHISMPFNVNVSPFVSDGPSKLLLDNPTYVSGAKASIGGVDLEFSASQTRIVEPCYRSSMIDIWDASAADGSLKHMKSLLPPGKPTPGRNHHRPHQAVLDPTGRFFVVPNLSGDTLLVIDSKDDRYEITDLTAVPPGVGPRHVAFLINDEMHYLVMVSELSNELFLFEADYINDTLKFKQIQQQSTYGNVPPKDPTKAAAAELEVAKNQRDIYLSNRYTGDETDHIAHFAFRKEGDIAQLDYVGRASTGGLQPRVFCLGADYRQEIVFVGNETGQSGLIALRRDPLTGILDPTLIATMVMSELIAPGHSEDKIRGPQFICELSHNM